MTVLRFLPLVALWAAPLPAQAVSRHTLRGADVALYDLAGVVRLEPGSGDAVTVELTRGGADAAQLKVAEGDLHGRATLRVLYPGDRIRYPQMSDGSTELTVRDDGTFGGHAHRHDHDDDDADDDGGGRRVRISSGGSGVEAWADLRVAVPAGRSLAVHLAVGKLTVTNVDGRLRLSAASAPVDVNGSKGDLHIEVGSGDVRLTGVDGEIRASTGSGSVELTRAHGRTVAVETGSGGVAVSGVETDQLNLETGSGDIRVTGAKAPRVGVETGSGTVAVEVQGPVDRLDVETGSGDVAITAPAGLSANLVIDTGSGEITTDFPLAVTRSAHDHLRGTIGDGKGKISVETGSGEVRLLKSK
jgi:lia operon protein LiaG